ncbi:MAG: ABC transporter permease [Hyphomicrobiales bacterium]|nr:MAG: ABC transporter permease [Hyphomicrobiales bacterium]
MSQTTQQNGNSAPPAGQDTGKPGRQRSRKGQTPIMPAHGVAGRPLLIAVTIMCYFASITIGAVVMVTQVVDGWTSGIASQITVQITQADSSGIDQRIASAVKILKATPGVQSAVPQSPEDAVKMLEPWLGKGNVLQDLPVPRLILVGIDPEAPPKLNALAARLSREVPGASLDDHSRWQTELTRTAGMIRLGAFSILALVVLTTISIVIFATRAAMAGNRDIVEVLHMIGARQSYIARQFQVHFLILGIKAGIIGVILGSATFFLFSLTLSQAGGQALLQQNNFQLIGSIALNPGGYAALLAVPPAAALISVLTSRFAVLRFLAAMI